MKRKAIGFILIPLLVLMSCQTYKESDSGVVIRIRNTRGPEAKMVRVTVMADDIIHVSATRNSKYMDNSLTAILKPDSQHRFTVDETGDAVEVITATTIVSVSLSTGQITFLDRDRKVILAESAGGRTLRDTSIEGSAGYVIRQVFDSPEGEGLYGLGQHQSDEINYKGKSESLFQYNTKVSMPFIVSTGNYGILWDNYALTRFGNPADYRQLSIFKLTGSDGKEGGLTASYYEQGDTGKLFVRRNEGEINYENLETIKGLPKDFPLNGSLVTWEGTLEAPVSAIYHFGLYYAGYVKLWIDGKLQGAERWRTAWNPNLAKFTAQLKAGEKHQIRIEWKPDGGVSYIGLRVLDPVDPQVQQKISFWSEIGDQIDYYFIRGNNMDGVIGGYRKLTGKAQVMPRWAMGFWQSRERYKTQDELVNAMAEFRKRHIPIDNIVMDWFYWKEDSWGSHEFDPERFPDPRGMLDQVHQLNGHLMISVWPKFYHTTEHYKELENIGAMYLTAVKDSVRDWVGKGYIGSFYDAYNPEARKLFWNQMYDHFGNLGIDAWWMDASEPDILSNATIQYRKQLMNPTALGPSAKFFNAYALVNAQAIYEGSRKDFPEQRAFLLTRSGFPGLQRYAAATWSGDIATRWEDMKAQISAGINYSLSGNPYWTMDIGGFCVENRYVNAREGSRDLEEWRELNVRWTQFGAFAPLFRTHGQYPFREVYNLAPESHPAYKTVVYYDKLRYRLMPYVYSLAGMAWLNDYTIMRGLAMDFANDPAVYNIGDQYLFGPSLMVNPVYVYGARERQLYLPKGTGWYNFHSGEYAEGGQTLTTPAPYDRMPLWVKAGSILPVGPEIEYASEKPGDPVTLWVYTGADATFTLYEDEGTNYNYEKGEYSLIPITYNESAGELTIGERKGMFPGMVDKRDFKVIWVSGNNPVGFDNTPKITQVVHYHGQILTIKK